MAIFYWQKAEDLDEFIRTAAPGDSRGSGAEFLESWEWGEFLSRGGATVVRLGWRANGRVAAAVTLVKKNLSFFGSYWFSPRGPVFAGLNGEAGKAGERTATGAATGAVVASTKKYLDDFAAEIRKIDRRAVFWRLEPVGLAESADPKNLIDGKDPAGSSWRRTIDEEPAQTLILDLNAAPDELREKMSAKTRYNIRLAEKKGVTISMAEKKGFSQLPGQTGISEFWRLMRLTAGRDGFRLHGEKHYENLIGFDPRFIKLYLARYQGRVIAAGLFSFFGDKVTYLHGASDNEFRSVMAPHLLQWTVIKEALKAGYRYYDFYGIDENKWPGVTRFKRGFGGRVFAYAGTWDYVFKPGVYRFYNWARGWRRRF